MVGLCLIPCQITVDTNQLSIYQNDHAQHPTWVKRSSRKSGAPLARQTLPDSKAVTIIYMGALIDKSLHFYIFRPLLLYIGAWNFVSRHCRRLSVGFGYDPVMLLQCSSGSGVLR